MIPVDTSDTIWISIKELKQEKFCSYCHLPMTVKQLNLVEACRMCFNEKCCIPFTGIPEIEYIHRNVFFTCGNTTNLKSIKGESEITSEEVLQDTKQLFREIESMVSHRKELQDEPRNRSSACTKTEDLNSADFFPETFHQILNLNTSNPDNLKNDDSFGLHTNQCTDISGISSYADMTFNNLGISQCEDSHIAPSENFIPESSGVTCLSQAPLEEVSAVHRNSYGVGNLNCNDSVSTVMNSVPLSNESNVIPNTTSQNKTEIIVPCDNINNMLDMLASDTAGQGTIEERVQSFDDTFFDWGQNEFEDENTAATNNIIPEAVLLSTTDAENSFDSSKENQDSSEASKFSFAAEETNVSSSKRATNDECIIDKSTATYTEVKEELDCKENINDISVGGIKTFRCYRPRKRQLSTQRSKPERNASLSKFCIDILAGSNSPKEEDSSVSKWSQEKEKRASPFLSPSRLSDGEEDPYGLFNDPCDNDSPPVPSSQSEEPNLKSVFKAEKFYQQPVEPIEPMVTTIEPNYFPQLTASRIPKIEFKKLSVDCHIQPTNPYQQLSSIAIQPVDTIPFVQTQLHLPNDLQQNLFSQVKIEIPSFYVGELPNQPNKPITPYDSSALKFTVSTIDSGEVVDKGRQEDTKKKSSAKKVEINLENSLKTNTKPILGFSELKNFGGAKSSLKPGKHKIRSGIKRHRKT